MAERFFVDLRGIACPMNFVKTKLLLDKMPVGECLQVVLDGGEPVESVSSSVSAEGHTILKSEQDAQGHYTLLIKKA